MDNGIGLYCIRLTIFLPILLEVFISFPFYVEAECNQDDRSALVALKSIAGSSAENWEGGDCCKWKGIVCDHRDNRVISIDIETKSELSTENHTIPVQLCYLRYVEKIKVTSPLKGSGLHGSIPECLCKLETLTLLHLVRHNLSGGIPSCISNLEILMELDLHSNGLTVLRAAMNSRNIPAELGILSNLTTVDISDNYLNGKIPDSIVNLTSLNTLNLSRNNLTGEIPRALSNLGELKNLDLAYNNLSRSTSTEVDDELKNRFSNTSFEGNPQLCGSLYTCEDHIEDHGGLNTVGKIVLAVSVSGAFVLLGLWFMYCTVRSKRLAGAHASSNSNLASEHLRFTAQDLWIATERFAESNMLGWNDCASVYRGTLEDGETVAIKMLKLKQSNDANTNFLELFGTACAVRHRNLLKPLGYCLESGAKAFVSEYINSGNLDKWLHGDIGCQFRWETRFNIAVGIARALVYLHFEGGGEPIVHCGVKPNNIFIDDDLEPLVGDYGIVQFLRKHGESSSMLPQTNGYVAPECKRSESVTTKADVYSYGMVLLELLTLKRPTCEEVEGDLAGWVRSNLPDRSSQVLDPGLLTTSMGFKKKTMVRVLGLALMCTREDPERRPSMKDVLEMLIQIKNKSRSMAEVIPLHDIEDT
eukprot:Gb_40893 [translate_table: standard]